MATRCWRRSFPPTTARRVKSVVPLFAGEQPPPFPGVRMRDRAGRANQRSGAANSVPFEESPLPYESDRTFPGPSPTMTRCRAGEDPVGLQLSNRGGL